MHSFKDNKGRQWDLELNGWQMKRIQERCGVRCRNPEAVLTAAADPALLCDIIWVMCESQANERKISDEDFGRSLGGDAIDEATSAFLAEAVPFLPNEARPALTKVLARMKSVKPPPQDKMEAAIDQTFAKLEKEANENLETLLAGTSTGSLPGK